MPPGAAMPSTGPDAFHVPGPGPYLLTHSVGCLPRVAEAELESAWLRPWREQGGDAWGAWLDGLSRFREALAGLLGGDASAYCPQVNLSSALSKLLGALPPPRPDRNVLVLAEESFPSMGFVLQQAPRLGYALRWLPRDAEVADPGSWAPLLRDDVAAVLVTHVHSNTGVVAPVPDVARLCAGAGALCIVDAAQSAGILPWSVESLGADVILGSCIKWLCGGPGAGWMWLRPSLLPSLEPLDTGWFSHADPFAFDIHDFQPAPDARRFWGGTPDVAPFVMAAASLHLLAGVGVPAILAHNRRLVAAFADALPPRWRRQVQPERSGGTLCLRAGDSLEAVTRALGADGARFDCRGDTLRLSFHLCNTESDALRAARAWPA